MRKIILALTIMVFAASFAAADTIYLKDGRTIRGTVLGFTNGRFVVRFESRSVQVTLDSNWTDTGVDLRRGEKVQVSASGVITAGRTRITPDGLRSTDPTSPLPRAAEGELIGAIGDDPRAPIMELGSTREFTADRDGRLYLTANRGSFNDTRGAFTVQIKSERDLNALDTADDSSRRRTPGIRSRDRLPSDQNDRGRDRNRTPRDVTIEVPGTS